MGMGNKTIITLVLSIAVISLLVLSGCKGKGSDVDLNSPPPLPEEAAAEAAEEQPPAPPASTGEGSAPGQQPARLPLLG